MKIAIPTEILAGENRVAVTPDVARKLIKDGFDVCVQKDAGLKAGYIDAAYEKAGCAIGKDAAATWNAADVVLKINKPQETADGGHEVDLMPEGSMYISFLQPLFDPALSKRVAARKVTSFSMDAVPRTTRAQSMDALSSQANLAGYKAVLLAADNLKKLMPMLMTAAGTIQPARCLVLGAGVAGLQAIATARRLGGVVEAFDVRSVVEEQIKSLGAKFVKLKMEESGEGAGGYAKALSEEAQASQRKQLGDIAAGQDMIITTAAIPGRTAPRLIEADAVARMKPGSVIVDLAAATGGNVEGSKPDEMVETENGVLIFGPTNLVSDMALDASQMYAKNITTLFGLMGKEGALEIDWEDDILCEAVITRDGEIVHKRTLEVIAKQ